ncbi:hypothetical protein [Bacillus solimangrovi]|nr:hypothetical protein [Bacillus solimangrovi]
MFSLAIAIANLTPKDGKYIDEVWCTYSFPFSPHETKYSDWI